MSGPNPPGPDSPGSDLPEQEPGSQPTHDQPTHDVTGDTESHSQAYSAPESEQFTSGPYVPADPALYDYDSYDPATELVEQPSAPRWPWVVGVVAILAAVALVVSVSLLVTSTDTNKLATPATSSSTSTPPVQDEITTTPPPPPTAPPPPTPPPAPPPPAENRDGHPGAAATARHRAAAPGDDDGAAAARYDHHDARGTASGHLLGDRDEGARRHHHRHLRRRIGAQPHAAQRLHSVVADGDPDLAVRGRLRAGLQPVPGQQTELLDHHERWHGVVVQYRQLRADQLLMPRDTETAGRSRLSPGTATRSADGVDRGLLALCAVIWLGVLGSGVAATVALVDLGRGHPASSGGSHTPWLLYAVIGASALVIVGAVPLLLRARRAAQADPPPAAVRPSARAAPTTQRGTEAPHEEP